jgi:hypothetical protein
MNLDTNNIRLTISIPLEELLTVQEHRRQSTGRGLGRRASIMEGWCMHASAVTPGRYRSHGCWIGYSGIRESTAATIPMPLSAMMQVLVAGATHITDVATPFVDDF